MIYIIWNATRTISKSCFCWVTQIQCIGLKLRFQTRRCSPLKTVNPLTVDFSIFHRPGCLLKKTRHCLAQRLNATFPNTCAHTGHAAVSGQSKDDGETLRTCRSCMAVSDDRNLCIFYVATTSTRTNAGPVRRVPTGNF